MEGLTLTSSMFDGLLSAITTNLGVLIPVGLTIMGIMVAVSLIPRIVYKFLQESNAPIEHFNVRWGQFFERRDLF